MTLIAPEPHLPLNAIRKVYVKRSRIPKLHGTFTSSKKRRQRGHGIQETQLSRKG